ncbi:MAG: Pyruvate:ferredoxin oxidoreductase [Succiniclasticum sp.]|jgi:pyruvate-ferredoxin/flavodoxin oxidoreductase
MTVMKTMDGNEAAAYASYAFIDVACIYPITPSSPMAEHVDEWASQGKKNLFGQTVKLMEMQSEAGASGAVHGSLQAGALTSTYTASQGLLLMIPNMYKISGELLPAVFNVSARALATSSLSIFGDHQDVMAARQTGFAMLASGSVQEVMDLTGVAHMSAIKARVPFLNFFDGFRTSHEIQKIEVFDYENYKKMVDWDAIRAFRQRSLNPDAPVIRGTAQNPDIYFQSREAVNKYYEAVPDIVENYLAQVSKITGREYHLFNYYGPKDAELLLVTMGSSQETCVQTAEVVRAAEGTKVGVLAVHLYRPFDVRRFLDAIPATVKKIAVLDRTKEPGSLGEPLYLDVCNAFYHSDRHPLIVGGRYGLGSKEFTPSDCYAIIDNLRQDQPKNSFTVGITDDVTGLSLHTDKVINPTPEGTKACKFWGLGSDGTVGANKSAIKIIGDHTDMYAQGYFAYDSKKSGGITVSHLRFGKQPIREPYLVSDADYVAVHNQSYVDKYDVLAGLKEGGNFLLNCNWTVAELEQHLPAAMKRYIAKKKINFYIIDAVKIAQEIGLGGRINMIMQSAFFKLADIIPVEDAVRYLKEAVVESYGKKGQNVVDMNNAAIDRGIDAIVKVDVPAAWADAVDEKGAGKTGNAFVDEILVPMNRQEGDKLPVSKLLDHADGTFPSGTAAYEKRGIAINVPEWNVANCIQCNQCSFVCPHAAIRPVLLNEEEAKAIGYDSKPAVGVKDGSKFAIVISPYDCQGCGNCAQICPAPKKALTMKPLATQLDKAPAWEYAVHTVTQKPNPMKKSTVKGSQFEQPLFEFSGACAGCGETPYVKLITQLFGDRMMIANATGCSSIWGASTPAMPYTKNRAGHGPSWANSLFEDNAEYGLGMFLGVEQERDRVENMIDALLAAGKGSAELQAAMKDWKEQKNVSDGTRERADVLAGLLEKEMAGDKELAALYGLKQYFVKRSHWIIGGDGWGYDIGYGGLDHVLASGKNVNVLVLDTEVYSNTGGQSSKSTPTAAIAQFAASGKRTKKKDLGMMAMSYGYVYVAQVAMGSDKNQLVKALTEAEAYDGPSLIIAYCPCINHGLKAGMGCSQLEEKRAVECGYWATYRYNPDKKKEEQNPFTLDSKEPTGNFRDYLLGEVRFASLQKVRPQLADELYKKTEADAMERLANYKRLAGKE